MAGKTASIRRPKRITAKQRVARKKNIAIARMHKKRGAKKFTKKKVLSPSAYKGQQTKRKKAAKKKQRRTAGEAFKGAYEQVQRSTGGRVRKDYARRIGHTAAMKVDMIGGKAIARKYARGVARKKFKMDRKGAKQFSRGYINSIMNDLNRGA